MRKGGIGRSIGMKLSAIAREREIPFEKVLTEFLLERMLARLVNSKALSSVFIFKGGYVGRRAYGSPRYTIDLDALLRTGTIEALEAQVIKGIESDLEDGTWFRFESTLDLQTQGEYPGVRFVFRSGVGEELEDLKRAQIVNFDIGVGDFIQPVKLELKPILDERPISWTVYSKEVMVAEKLHSFLSRPLGNSRSKDLFDLMFYLPDCDSKLLKEAAIGTFSARGDAFPNNIANEFKALNLDLLKRGWKSAITDLEDVGSFEQVFTKVVAELKQKFSKN